MIKLRELILKQIYDKSGFYSDDPVHYSGYTEKQIIEEYDKIVADRLLNNRIGGDHLSGNTKWRMPAILNGNGINLLHSKTSTI